MPTDIFLMPPIITAPGQYRTRRGELVTITEVAKGHMFACRGTYPCGTVDHWHKSGRLYAGRESINDIISKNFKTS